MPKNEARAAAIAVIARASKAERGVFFVNVVKRLWHRWKELYCRPGGTGPAVGPAVAPLWLPGIIEQGWSAADCGSAYAYVSRTPGFVAHVEAEVNRRLASYLPEEVLSRLHPFVVVADTRSAVPPGAPLDALPAGGTLSVTVAWWLAPAPRQILRAPEAPAVAHLNMELSMRRPRGSTWRHDNRPTSRVYPKGLLLTCKKWDCAVYSIPLYHGMTLAQCLTLDPNARMPLAYRYVYLPSKDQFLPLCTRAEDYAVYGDVPLAKFSTANAQNARVALARLLTFAAAAKGDEANDSVLALQEARALEAARERERQGEIEREALARGVASRVTVSTLAAAAAAVAAADDMVPADLRWNADDGGPGGGGGGGGGEDNGCGATGHDDDANNDDDDDDCCDAFAMDLSTRCE